MSRASPLISTRMQQSLAGPSRVLKRSWYGMGGDDSRRRGRYCARKQAARDFARDGPSGAAASAVFAHGDRRDREAFGRRVLLGGAPPVPLSPVLRRDGLRGRAIAVHRGPDRAVHRDGLRDPAGGRLPRLRRREPDRRGGGNGAGARAVAGVHGDDGLEPRR